MTPLLLPLTIAVFTLALPSAIDTFAGWRDRFLRAVLLFGVYAVLLTEILGAFHLILREALLACWTTLFTAALASIVKRRRGIRFPPLNLSRDPVTIFCLLAIAVILTLTGITAAFSPPNSADAMAYHLPRVVYWAEQASVRFFPTPYLNQIMLQPFAEYLMLHTYLLSEGDHFINFGQWFASFVSVIAVSSVARLFGATARGQAIAALFCATIPSGILASSGAKNDYVLAACLIATVYFTLRFFTINSAGAAFWPGAALGLALLTKATAYLFAPWVLLAIIVTRFRHTARARLVTGIAIALACTISLNAPQFLRNYELSGSIMGFDSAQGDGLFRWRNDAFGWKQTASNAIRNLSEQLGARSESWRNGVFHLALAAHEHLGIDVNDPATTWPGSAFHAPLNANHEADANNRWQLAILLVLSVLLAWRARRTRDFAQPLYAAALLFAFLTFSAYLKWQPFFARMFLPLFVLGAPLAGLLGTAHHRLRLTVLQFAILLFLLSNSRSAVSENWTRPLTGSRSLFRVPRDDQYFADMSQWNNQTSYQDTANALAQSTCRLVGIDITNLQLEYPLQILVREHHPRFRFLHTGVDNVTTRYPQPVDGTPCAIVCLDCAGDPARRARYVSYPKTRQFGKFVLFQRN